MGNAGPKKFKGKDEIIQYLVKISDKLGIDRDDLATRLGISKSAFYGYITRREIPLRSYQRLQELYEGTTPLKSSNARSDRPDMLSGASLEDLIQEIEGRGWLVDLRRKAANE